MTRSDHGRPGEGPDLPDPGPELPVPGEPAQPDVYPDPMPDPQPIPPQDPQPPPPGEVTPPVHGQGLSSALSRARAGVAAVRPA